MKFIDSFIIYMGVWLSVEAETKMFTKKTSNSEDRIITNEIEVQSTIEKKTFPSPRQNHIYDDYNTNRSTLRNPSSRFVVFFCLHPLKYPQI